MVDGEEESVMMRGDVMGRESFRGDKRLKRIVLHNLIRIDDFAFEGCSELTEVVIPALVKSIGANAFIGCDKQASVVIGKIKS